MRDHGFIFLVAITNEYISTREREHHHIKFIKWKNKKKHTHTHTHLIFYFFPHVNIYVHHHYHRRRCRWTKFDKVYANLSGYEHCMAMVHILLICCTFIYNIYIYQYSSMSECWENEPKWNNTQKKKWIKREKTRSISEQRRKPVTIHTNNNEMRHHRAITTNQTKHKMNSLSYNIIII